MSVQSTLVAGGGAGGARGGGVHAGEGLARGAPRAAGRRLRGRDSGARPAQAGRARGARGAPLPQATARAQVRACHRVCVCVSASRCRPPPRAAHAFVCVCVVCVCVRVFKRWCVPMTGYACGRVGFVHESNTLIRCTIGVAYGYYIVSA